MNVLLRTYCIVVFAAAAVALAGCGSSGVDENSAGPSAQIQHTPPPDTTSAGHGTPPSKPTSDTAVNSGDEPSGDEPCGNTAPMAARLVSSRGFQFQIKVAFELPPTFETEPGYDVGETDMNLRIECGGVTVTNMTPGRDLPLFPPAAPGVDPLDPKGMMWVRSIWRVPRKLVRDWSFRGYARTDLLIYGPTSVAEGASTPLGAFSQEANGRVAAIADKSVGRVKRILAGKPAYVALIAPTAEESYLAGHWSDCDDAAVVAAWTGDGRRVELTESVCETIT